MDACNPDIFREGQLDGLSYNLDSTWIVKSASEGWKDSHK